MGRIAGLSVIIIALYVFGLIAFAFVANSDLYGRLTETKTALGVGMPGREGQSMPTVRLVLHRLIEGENAVEASVIIFAADEPSDLVKDGQKEYTAEVRDGTSYQPYGLSSRVVLSKESAEAHAGQNSIATQSERFTLPALASVSGFPFDDLWTRPIVDFYENGLYTNKFEFEVQRALPGRLMRLSNGTIVDVYLTRSPTEKALVIATSIVFLFLSAVLAFVLFSTSSGLKTVDELLARYTKNLPEPCCGYEIPPHTYGWNQRLGDRGDWSSCPCAFFWRCCIFLSWSRSTATELTMWV